MHCSGIREECAVGGWSNNEWGHKRERAEALKNEGEYEGAEGLYSAVLCHDPSDPEAHLGLGLVYCFTGRFEESLLELQRAAECRPGWVDAHLNLAKTYAMLGRYEEARQEFEQVLGLCPDHVEAKRQLGYFPPG